MFQLKSGGHTNCIQILWPLIKWSQNWINASKCDKTFRLLWFIQVVTCSRRHTIYWLHSKFCHRTDVNGEDSLGAFFVIVLTVSFNEPNGNVFSEQIISKQLCVRIKNLIVTRFKLKLITLIELTFHLLCYCCQSKCFCRLVTFGFFAVSSSWGILGHPRTSVNNYHNHINPSIKYYGRRRWFFLSSDKMICVDVLRISTASNVPSHMCAPCFRNFQIINAFSWIQQIRKKAPKMRRRIRVQLARICFWMRSITDQSSKSFRFHASIYTRFNELNMNQEANKGELMNTSDGRL